jgi:hypothetical protein
VNDDEKPEKNRLEARGIGDILLVCNTAIQQYSNTAIQQYSNTAIQQ